VTDVAVNPRFYEWATGSIDGHARTFRYPALKVKNATRVRPGGGGGMQTIERVNAIKV